METRVLKQHETRGINRARGGQCEGVAVSNRMELDGTVNSLSWEQSWKNKPSPSPEINLDKLLEEISVEDKDIMQKNKINETNIEIKSLECLEIQWSFLDQKEEGKYLHETIENAI